MADTVNTIPKRLADFIEKAANGKTGASARFAVYSRISRQILYVENSVKWKKETNESPPRLIYPQAVYEYIASRFGKSSTIPTGDVLVTMEHIRSMHWIE